MTHDQLIKLTHQATLGLQPDDVRRECAISGSKLNKIMRALRRYDRAKEASKAYGFIGVGCISFADARLAKFAARIGLEVGE